MDYNKIILKGRATDNAIIRYTADPEPRPVAKFDIAVSRHYKDKDGNWLSDFFTIACFDKWAEKAEKEVLQGSTIMLDGRLQKDYYIDKDGKKIPTIEIVVSWMDVYPPMEKSANANSTQKPASAPKNQSVSQSAVGTQATNQPGQRTNRVMPYNKQKNQ